MKIKGTLILLYVRFFKKNHFSIAINLNLIFSFMPFWYNHVTRLYCKMHKLFDSHSCVRLILSLEDYVQIYNACMCAKA